MTTTFRFPDADESKGTAPVGLLQRSLSAPVHPPIVEESDTNFFAAVMAAGGNVTRSVSVSEYAKANAALHGSNGNGVGVNMPMTVDADTSLNEDLFFPSVSAAAAITLSPSFGPVSSSSSGGSSDNLYYPGYGGSHTWAMGQQQQQAKQPRGSSLKEEMPSLGLPLSAVPEMPQTASSRSSSAEYHMRMGGHAGGVGESPEEYQMRNAMAGMSLGSGASGRSSGSSLTASAAAYDPSQYMQQQMYYAQDTYGSMYANGGGQYVQQQGYGRYQAEMYGAPTNQQGRMGVATASLAPVMDQRYAGAASYGGGGAYGPIHMGSEYGQGQPRMAYGGGGTRGGNMGAQGNIPYLKQQGMLHQHGGMGNGRRSSQQQHQMGHNQMWNQQGGYQDDSYGSGMMPSGNGGGNSNPRQPRSSILDELRAAMRASSANTRHRVVMNTSAPNGFTRPPANGMFIAPNTQQQGNGVNNAQMMQAVPTSVPYTLADVKGHAVELAQDQFGSRWLQQQLSSSTVSAQDKQTLFMELLPAAKELASDTFGNYCVQILLNPSVGTPEQQRALCEGAFEGNMLELSRNTYACRCIQSLIKLFQLGDDIIPVVRQDKMLQELKRDILGLVTDSNANHVAQQIIERIRPIERISFVLDAFKGNYVTLAKDPYGCRVCQRVLEHATPEYVEPALEELLSAVDDLVMDSMGNYVIQHIVTASGDKYGPQKVRLVEAVKKKLLLFATHKFASNVVEKVLEYGDAATRRSVVQTMLDGQTPLGNGGPMVPLLQVMMSDLFANYVCQRSLAVADRDQLIRLVAIVRGSAQELRRMTYGKHILSACEKAAAAAGIP